MLDGTTRSMPAWADGVRLLAVLLLGALLTGVLLRFGPVAGLLASFAMLGLLLAAYAAAWSRFWVVPMAAPMLTILGLYALNTAYGFLRRRAANARSPNSSASMFRPNSPTR